MEGEGERGALLDAWISRDEAAQQIVAVVEDYGLRPVEPPPLPRRIGIDELGVVCWMGVLPAAT